MHQFFRNFSIKLDDARGTWVAQSVKPPILDFSSGHNLMVCGVEPHAGLCTGSVEPAWDSLSPLLSAPPLLALSLLKTNIH